MARAKRLQKLSDHWVNQGRKILTDAEAKAKEEADKFVERHEEEALALRKDALRGLTASRTSWTRWPPKDHTEDCPHTSCYCRRHLQAIERWAATSSARFHIEKGGGAPHFDRALQGFAIDEQASRWVSSASGWIGDSLVLAASEGLLRWLWRADRACPRLPVPS